MDKAEIEELWRLLGKCGDERVFELARLAVCELRSQRAAMAALKEAMEACNEK